MDKLLDISTAPTCNVYTVCIKCPKFGIDFRFQFHLIRLEAEQRKPIWNQKQTEKATMIDPCPRKFLYKCFGTSYLK